MRRLNVLGEATQHRDRLNGSGRRGPSGMVVFDAYLSSVTDAVVDEVLPKWQAKLGSVDVFTRSHAWEVVERLRIDA